MRLPEAYVVVAEARQTLYVMAARVWCYVWAYGGQIEEYSEMTTGFQES